MSYFYSWDDNGSKASGSKCFGGNLLQITHRWHECNKHGHYLVTFAWGNFIRNVHCIVDDFGNLQAV